MAAGSVSGGGDALARAHDGLLRQGDLQFDFALQVPPEPPAWLKALADLLRAAAPLFQWLFWIGLALGAGMVLWFVGRELLAARFPSLRRKPAVLSEPEWRPSAVRARTLLEDADRLAAAGRYGEAAHLILFRSIEDIDQRWPGQLAPALTSRDIGRLAILPALAQQTFAGIAEVVEHSVFGGRPVDAETYAACRGAYQAFALRARA
jgi:hypothetical protein